MKALSILACGLLLTAAAQAQQLAQSDTTQRAAAPVPEVAATPVPEATASPAVAVDPELPPAPAPAPSPAAPAVATTLECNTLTGRVADAFDYPLTGATVMLRSQGQAFSLDAFSTNADGRYLITSKKPIPRDAVLEVTAAGYNSYSLPLGSCKPLDVTLEPLPGTKFKGDGRIKKTAATGKIR